jgi:hypothetical protein
LRESANYPEAQYSSPGVRGALNRVTERLAVCVQRCIIGLQFRVKLGYTGNFENPKSYQEKIQFRKLYGNHAFYALVTDKFRVREYVAERIDAQHLIPLHGVYDRIRASDFDPLPQQFVVKANHGSKWNRVVLDKSKLDVDATVRHFNKLCRWRYGWKAGERHYNYIRPKIIIEHLLQDDSGGLPWNYCFYCFHGPGGFDYYYTIESPADATTGAIIANDGKILFMSKMSEQELAAHARPARFSEMVDLANALSVDFDFVRVDLYCTKDQVYFGELTCTPHAGYSKGASEQAQHMRNEMWHLDADNRRLYAASGRNASRVRK